MFINMMHIKTYLVFGVPSSRFDLVLQVKPTIPQTLPWRHIFFSSKQIKCIKQGLPIFLWGLQYWVFPGPKTWVFDRCPQITGRDYNNLVLVKNLSFDTTSEPITGIIVTLIHISMRFLKNIKTKNFYAKTWRKGSCPRRPLGIQWTAFARVFFEFAKVKLFFVMEFQIHSIHEIWSL